MVNAVMDAIALLSSLATDLDIMLNDLRTAPNSRLSSSSSNQLRTTGATNNPYTPLTINVDTNSYFPEYPYLQYSNSQDSGQHSDYLYNYSGNTAALKLNQSEANKRYSHVANAQQFDKLNQHKKSAFVATSSAATADAATAATSIQNLQQQSQRFLHCNENNRFISQNNTQAANNCIRPQQQSQQHNYDSDNNNNNNNCNMNSNVFTNKNNLNGNFANKSSLSTKNSCTSSSSSTSSPSFQGLITYANAVHSSKLPLYTYQHKQLQQPQTLHIQLLQQQQATKAIASQIPLRTEPLDVDGVQHRYHDSNQNVVTKQQQQNTKNDARTTTKNNCDSKALQPVTVAATLAKTTTTTTRTTTTATTSIIDFRIKSVTKSTRTGKSATSTSIQNKSNSTASTASATTSNSSSAMAAKWLQSTLSATTSSSTSYLRSSDSAVIGHNQLKSNLINNANISNGNASSKSSMAAATAQQQTHNNNNNNKNANNNNCNNATSNNSLSSHQRLPFCGLDSIKGSDNNGDVTVSKQQLIDGKANVANGNVVATAGVGGRINFDLKSAVTTSAAVMQQTCVFNDASSGDFHSLDVNDSSLFSNCGDGQFEDDMQALLPNCSRLSRDELSQSRTSLISSSDGGILAEGETSSETSHCTDDDSPPCDLGLVERLLLTHPVWFLPGIQRSGAVHFLQGKEEGNFIVRGSSQPNTMAVSVRLPPDTGPYIEHYLIQSNEGVLCLESSRFKFDSIPSLIAHYAQCCDELPVQLELPRALREARNRQQLSSLALLGQEFWRYPMSCPKQSEPEAQFLDAKSPNSITETSGLGTTLFSNSADGSGSKGQQQKHFSPINNCLFSQAGTPSDTNSSFSSFTTSGGQHMHLMSPESVDSIILTMSPCDLNGHHQRNGILGLGANSTDLINTSTNNLSTFKSNSNINQMQNNFKNSNSDIRTPRPKPPNTLNLDLRKPAPTPPLRWSKPLSPNSPHPPAVLDPANNFTVTTTVTFSVDNPATPQFVEVTTPAANNGLNSIMSSNSTFQTFSKRLSPEGECKDTISSQGSSTGSRKCPSQSSKDSNNSQRKILSPCTPNSVLNGGGLGGKSRKSKARKESKHYQESDILESPEIYCRSTLHDKISDYEDLWSHDPTDRTGLLTSFKPPDGQQGKRPDLLAETPTVTSSSALCLNSNVETAAPAAAISSNPTYPPLMPSCLPNDSNADNTSETQQLLKLSEEHKPRSRAGLILPGIMSQSLSEDHVFKGENTEGDTTPTAQTPVSRSKQGSPFYAEPADALRQAGLNASILRRSQRGPLLPANHRHSEPPKGGFVRTPMCPLLQTSEIEKIAGSLDELKKKQQQQQQAQPQQQAQQQQPSKRARGRFEQWQLDSSWEFMAKSDDANEAAGDYYGDYDTSEQWKESNSNDNHHAGHNKENALNADLNSKDSKPKPITVHQIIAKRLPDLNLPELVRCSTPSSQQQNNQKPSIFAESGTHKSFDRLSSYDNVERNYALGQCFFNGLDSAQSDDGTVFSEPWDSSQWDTFMPHDDATINSDTIHLSKCRPALSEDDTIIEELSSSKDLNSLDTLKPKKTKHATILRNPSIRDKEILCHPRNKVNIYSGGPGDSVRCYTLQLAQDQCTTFARNIENFISCTKDSREAAPQVVMRNMRQFMNGMKNYLVKHGEGKFHQEVESARGRLKSDEFLNLDAILETVMHQLVVLPLREHLYGMFVDYYTRSEAIQLLAQNVKYACGRAASDFGIRPTVTPPSSTSLQVISNLLLRLQEAELPLEKLELFLCIISTIFDATGCPRGQQLGADDFLPILVYVVAKCGFVGAEIEAEFMWGLLQPTLLNGEPGYYLTALCSAVHVLKNFMASETESGSASLDWRASSLPAACSSVLRVIIPDECNGSLQTRTLPVRPHTTTREVCRIIAHKARITNPQDYALFKLVDGEETPLNDNECPQDIRITAKGKHCMLAYKRIDAKIAWPTAAQPNFS